MSSIIQNNQVFNNEVPFCRVYSIESKKLLEERFLAHRISYFIEWQDKSIFQRIFDRNGSRIVCTFRINKGDILKARELCQGIEGIKFKDLGDLVTPERIRRRSEAVKSEELGMEVPSLRFENKMNGSMGVAMEDRREEPVQDQYDDQRYVNHLYSSQQFAEQQYSQQQYDDQYEGYEEGYEGGYEEGYYEEGYEGQEEYYEEGYEDGYRGYNNYRNYDDYNG